MTIDYIWISRIAKARCIPEVFDAQELVICCKNNYEKYQRIIKVRGQSPISLTPLTSIQMLRIVEPEITFKVDNVL
jgi:hypothetical protein